MDIAVAFAELAILVAGYLFTCVINEPVWFLIFALVWAGLVIMSERLR